MYDPTKQAAYDECQAFKNAAFAAMVTACATAAGLSALSGPFAPIIAAGVFAACAMLQRQVESISCPLPTQTVCYTVNGPPVNTPAGTARAGANEGSPYACW